VIEEELFGKVSPTIACVIMSSPKGHETFGAAALVTQLPKLQSYYKMIKF
jgi:hypothetical protein